MLTNTNLIILIHCTPYIPAMFTQHLTGRNVQVVPIDVIVIIIIS